MQWNPNLTFLIDQFEAGTRGVILEGSSRSGKTWSSIDFLIYIASKHPQTTVNIVRETYRSFKTTLYDDFNRRLPMWHLQSPFANIQDRGAFWLKNTKINMLGADDPAKFHGATCDFFWINEILDTPQSVFDQMEQRCRQFWWGDYNPKVTDHWVYNRLEKRSDVKFLRTTFLDNPNIALPERAKILSYDPSNPINIKQGTADDYMWKVYGLGIRCAPEGLIFPNVEWIDEFPATVEQIIYGLDFGYTQSPTAFVKIGRNKMDLYLQSLLYTPFENADLLAPYLAQVLTHDCHCWADGHGEGAGMISDLRIKELPVYAANMFSGSIKYGIDLMKRFKIHIVRDKNFEKEQLNYRYRQINGIRLNEPIDEFNHLWDAARGAIISEFRMPVNLHHFL